MKIYSKIIIPTTVALFLTLTTASSQAALITIDVVGADWTNVTGGANLEFINSDFIVGNEQIRWGGSGTPTARKSGYRFEGAAPPAFSVDTGVEFVLGRFTHFNFPIPAGTAITSAQLNLTTHLTIDGTPLTEGPFTFSFLHNETPNTSLLCCNDIVNFSNVVSSDTFSIGSVDYTLAMTGFLGADNMPVNSFSTQERRVNRARVTAMFTEVAIPIPEPGTLALLGLGLLGLAALRKRSE